MMDKQEMLMKLAAKEFTKMEMLCILGKVKWLEQVMAEMGLANKSDLEESFASELGLPSGQGCLDDALAMSKCVVVGSEDGLEFILESPEKEFELHCEVGSELADSEGSVDDEGFAMALQSIQDAMEAVWDVQGRSEHTVQLRKAYGGLLAAEEAIAGLLMTSNEGAE